MKSEKDSAAVVQLPEQVTSYAEEGRESDGRKAFVEPEISDPVDVLEATTFFVAATSGVI